jgi:hypothetical protein
VGLDTRGHVTVATYYARDARKLARRGIQLVRELVECVSKVSRNAVVAIQALIEFTARQSTESVDQAQVLRNRGLALRR